MRTACALVLAVVLAAVSPPAGAEDSQQAPDLWLLLPPADVLYEGCGAGVTQVRVPPDRRDAAWATQTRQTFDGCFAQAGDDDARTRFELGAAAAALSYSARSGDGTSYAVITERDDELRTLPNTVLTMPYWPQGWRPYAPRFRLVPHQYDECLSYPAPPSYPSIAALIVGCPGSLTWAWGPRDSVMFDVHTAAEWMDLIAAALRQSDEDYNRARRQRQLPAVTRQVRHQL